MPEKQSVSIMWFRRDLRLSDNQALTEAVKVGAVLPIFINSQEELGLLHEGAMSHVWLHFSLEKLNSSLSKKLNYYIGDPIEVFNRLLKRFEVTGVFWNEGLGFGCQEQDKKIKDLLMRHGVESHIFDSNYLWGVSQVLKDDGSFYKVFTAYKKRAYKSALKQLYSAPRRKRLVADSANKITLTSLKLLPKKAWYKHIIAQWKVGEKAAEKKLEKFLEEGLSSYQVGRDQPSMDSTSRLSPHLHFGEISPRQVWEVISTFGPEYATGPNTEAYLSEIVWREFSRYLLHYFPKLPSQNFNSKFKDFPWVRNKRLLGAWKKGQTGFPLVDAGMRELWQTGYMHNRVRMVVASFLVKNLMIHWHKGRDWFEDCLVDADIANNNASWQWVAGCGADAAPYFRIFNPITQGEKFDKNGLYTRLYVPELKLLPDKYLYKPWEAPAEVLEKAGVVLGKTYPKPVVDLKSSRERALAAYKKLSR